MKLVGDFNGDGRDDIALTRVADLSTIPIAFSNGDGSFRIAHADFPAAATFAGWASIANVKAIIGDFDRDGSSDIALTGGDSWVTIPVALSNGDGTFRVFNELLNIPDFGGWSHAAQAKLAGHFR